MEGFKQQQHERSIPLPNFQTANLRKVFSSSFKNINFLALQQTGIVVKTAGWSLNDLSLNPSRAPGRRKIDLP